VYARQHVQGAAEELYCVSAQGDVVGVYVLNAATAPAAPTELPETVQVQNATYVFNQVEVDIDISILVQVDVIQLGGAKVTLYADKDVPGRPTRVYAVAPGGKVVGQYVETTLVVTLQHGAATGAPSTDCAGEPGALNSRGLPAHLPNRFQFNEIAYTFVRADAPTDAGQLTRLGCVGPFEVASTAADDSAKVLYLRVPGEGQTTAKVYRFEVATTFQVVIGPAGNPSQVNTGEKPEDQYRLTDTWVPYLYASQTVILFVDNPDDATPDVLYAVNVGATVVGDVIGEYQRPGESTTVSKELTAAATDAGINPDLTINGQQYLLIAIYTPVGTTNDGFVTLFSSKQTGSTDTLLGRDKRRTELFLYETSKPAKTGG